MLSLVVRYSSIRALLALAVQESMNVHQMDVVMAFLNGMLDEEIYMGMLNKVKSIASVS